jgi:[protein-PII] uridylyltransferase
MREPAYIEQILAISPDIERMEFVEKIKALSGNALECIKAKNFEPWSMGKGFEISRKLTRFKDTVILKMIEYIGGVPEGVAVVAVGGYGRCELSPFSDVDILVLHREDITKLNSINALFYLLWDAGYKLGNSVRTIQNVTEHSAKDITFLTSVFESRILAGDKSLVDKMYKAIDGVLEKHREEYIRSEVDKFHSAFYSVGGSVLLKEPNLKESAGSLRSVHHAVWLNYAFNRNSGFASLKSVLPNRLYRRLFVAYDFILYLRNMVHFINGRGEDILIIEHHLKVAGFLRFRGDEVAMVKRLMRKVYDKTLDIFIISAFAIDTLYVAHFKKKIRKINNNFYTLNKKFFVYDNVDYDIDTAIDALYLFAKGHYFPSHSLIDYVKQSARLIDNTHRTSKDLFNKFCKILSLERSFDAVNVMKLSDFLYRYIKELAGIRHFIIYNPFHKFTVDEHSLEGIRALEQLEYSDYSSFDIGKFFILKELMKKHKNAIWVLKLAVILHDAGKAYPGDHCKNGVEIARSVFSVIPLANRYKPLIEFIIENHLLLSHIIRRSDVNNTEIILDLSRKFIVAPYPHDYLDFLYLFTYADIHATNPGNFSGYIAMLLRELYEKTDMAMKGKISRAYEEKLYREKISNIRDTVKDDNIREFIGILGKNYVISESEDDIISDFRVCSNFPITNHYLEARNYNEFLKVKIFVPDRLGLFATLAGILLINGANIVKANIFTYHSTAFDVFYITEIFGTDLFKYNMKSELDVWLEGLERSLHRDIENIDVLEMRITNLKMRIRKVPDIFKKPASVIFRHKEDSLYSVTVSGNDRPALIYDIARYFALHHIGIEGAIIDTIGWNIRDEFFVRAIEPLTDMEIEKHQARLCKVVEGG